MYATERVVQKLNSMLQIENNTLLLLKLILAFSYRVIYEFHFVTSSVLEAIPIVGHGP